MSAAATPRPPLLRRRSSVLQKAIQARKSFKDLSARAFQLESGHSCSSSADAIASFFVSKQQEAAESRLRDQLRLRRFTFRHLIHLLRFSAYCTWRSTLICASLFKDILHAKALIARIEIILDSPTCHSQVRDLLLSLAELHNLFSEDAIAQIHHAKLLLIDLEADLTVYVERAGVRALSGLSAFRHRTKHAFWLFTRPPKSRSSIMHVANCCANVQEMERMALPDAADEMAASGASLGTSKDAFDLAIASRNRAVVGTPRDALLGASLGTSKDAFDLTSASGNRAVVGASFGTPRDAPGMPEFLIGTPRGELDAHGNAYGILSSGVKSSQRNAFSSLHELHQQLHQMQVNIHSVIVMFETLMPLLSGTHSQGVGQHFMDILRDDPLMFDGVSEQITICHVRLSKHLDDVREQVLICFCYINKARDLAYAL